MLKFNSNELHRASPSIIGNRDILVQKPVTSPINILDIMTVNKGEELFIVSTKEIVACLSAIRPRTIENNRKNPIIIIFRQNIIETYSDFLKLKFGEII